MGRERGMNLGDLIATLDGFPKDAPIRYGWGKPVGRFTSWRGRYDELTLMPGNAEEERTVGDVLADARAAVGATFTGYKGGEYVMTERSPVWADDYGDCDYRAITGVQVQNGVVTLSTLVIEEYMP